jgi:hypothetical protein
MRSGSWCGVGLKLRALERDPESPFVNLEIGLSYWNQRNRAGLA